MSAPGKPLQDAAGAACRNAAAAIDDLYTRVQHAAGLAGTQLDVTVALEHLDEAIKLLDTAADTYYHKGEEEQE